MSVLNTWITVVLCVHSVLGAASSTTVAPVTTKQSTCPARTINYLTHTLPQQCLASPRTGVTHQNNTVSGIITSAASASGVDGSSQAGHTVKASIPGSEASSAANVTSSATSSSISSTSSIPTLSVTTVTATSLTTTIPVPLLPSAADEDSPLESSNFLSFEEWKKQNLIKSGQSEHLGRKPGVEQNEPRKRHKGVDNTLDSLGDDAEIDLDFSGLVPNGPDTVTDLGSRRDEQNNDSDKHAGTGSAPQISTRRKEAGTTSKERYNYASVDCAASVLKTNHEAKSPNTVIMENKDSYMLNKCSAANKFIILELCDDISIDTIVLANFEFFSSSFRTFRVSVSDKYPVKIDKWKTLGTFEARNTREVQAFLVTNPVIWARYVRVEFLTHYGNEFYCPVSLIRVHGYTMMEDYKHDQAMNMGDDDDDNEDVPDADPVEDKHVLEVMKESPIVDESEAIVEENGVVQVEQLEPLVTDVCPKCAVNGSTRMQQEQETSPNKPSVAHKALLTDDEDEVCLSNTSTMCTHTTRLPPAASTGTTVEPLSATPQSQHQDETNRPPLSPEGRASTAAPSHEKQFKKAGSSTIHSTVAGNGSTDSKKTTNSTAEQSRQNSSSKESTRTHAYKQSTSGTQSQPASPTMQESFFKSVQKRLQSLESNSSLSLQYIEEQSRALRDAFRKVEQRQLSKTSTFLEHLNQSVMNELREFRQQYDHLWQSTVIELELQREKYQKESQAMNARLGILADELIFQRRVAILQMVLILVCLGLVLFSRGAINNYLELPLVQSVLSRSPSSRWSNVTGDSRSVTPAMTRTRSTHQLGSKQGILKSHNRGLSDESNNEVLSASEMYSPPTPVSYDGFSDAEVTKSARKMEYPEFDPINIERPSTSPPVLPSIEDPTTPRSVSWPDEISIEGRMLSSPSPSVGKERLPEVKIEHTTPPGRHLTWDLPE